MPAPTAQSCGYRVHLDALASAKSEAIPLIQFANGAGERFSPARMKPQSVSIFAHGPDGVEHCYYGKWQ